MKWVIGAVAVVFFTVGVVQETKAASGELVTGRIQVIGHYSAAVGAEKTVVWSFKSGLITPFAVGCTSVTLTPATMGQSSYKTALNSLLLARALDKPVRFFAHAERDDGCGADYVEIQD
jgi:hypothetical protein